MIRERLRAGRSSSLAVAAALTFLASRAAAGGGVLHVPADYATIQAAVDAASAGETVLVADGVYTGRGNRDIDPAGKLLVIRSEHGPSACIIDCQATPTDPHRAFVIQSGETRALRVEGFTIRGGDTLPGAIADPFNGGAIQILGCSPTISNCVFTQNESACWGGAVYSAHGGSPLIESCLFVENHSGDDGGGFFCWNGASPVIVSTVFVRNTADVQGGAIANFGWNERPMMLVNVTIHDNYAPFGAAIANWGTTSVEHSIVWNNRSDGGAITGNTTLAVSNCDVEGGHPGTDNIDVDPLFAKDGYHLLASSPCIDAGAANVMAGAFDVDGHPRAMGSGADLGADEHVGLTNYR